MIVCVPPAAEDGLIRGLLTSVDCNVRGMSEAGYSALSQGDSPIAGLLTAMLTLYIGFIGFRLLIGRSPLRVGDLTLSALKIGAVLALATSWPTYQQLVFDTLFLGPEQMAGAMLGAIQAPGLTNAADPFAALQACYDELQASATYLNAHALGLASPLTGGPAGAALALNASALLMLLTSLGTVLAAKIVLGLLLGLGPIFVALMLFDATRGVFEGWLRACIAFALAPLMAALGLVVELTMVTPHIVRLAELRGQGLVDTAPANAVFLLTLISTGVSLALAIAVGVVAFSLRLPRWGAALPAERLETQASVEARPADRPAVTERRSEPRAAAVAAAAAAMERRDARDAVADGEPSSRRRISAGRADPGVATPAGFTAAGQIHRRTAQPRRTASNQRRDR